jgi:hypothetical protein
MRVYSSTHKEDLISPDMAADIIVATLAEPASSRLIGGPSLSSLSNMVAAGVNARDADSRDDTFSGRKQ